MLSSKQTDSCLVVNLRDKASTTEDAYQCNSSPHITGPNARAIFIIERADPNDGYVDNVVHYGQKICFTTNSYLSPKKFYVKSIQDGPMFHSKPSRFQQVIASTKKTYETQWEIEAVDPNYRFETLGEAIIANSPILIKHCSTCHYLASDLKEVKSDHGTEYEVNVHSYSTNNKSQNLALEFKGQVT